MAVQVVGVVVHSQLAHIGLVVAVPLSRMDVDSVETEFAVAEVNVGIGSGLVEAKGVGRDYANACLGCIVHMAKIFRGLSCMGRLSEVVVEGNILHWQRLV